MTKSNRLIKEMILKEKRIYQNGKETFDILFYKIEHLEFN